MPGLKELKASESCWWREGEEKMDASVKGRRDQLSGVRNLTAAISTDIMRPLWTVLCSQSDI